MTSLHRRARPMLGVPLLLVLVAAGWTPPVQAGTFAAFGPQTFRRTTGAPESVSVTFGVRDPAGAYTLRVHNGGLAGGPAAERVSSAVIRLGDRVGSWCCRATGSPGSARPSRSRWRRPAARTPSGWWSAT